MRSSKRLIILGITVLFLGAGIAAGSFVILKFFPSDGEDPEPPYQTPYQTPEPALESLEVLDVYYFNKPGGKIDIAARIKNPNPNHGAEEIEYTISLLASGSTVKEIQDSSYIMPEEEKYIILLNREPGGAFRDIELSIDSVVWKELNEFFSLELDVFDIKLERLPPENTFYARLAAFVKNNSIFGLTDIKVVGILFDTESEPIAVGRTSIQTVLEGETREVEMFWSNEIPLDSVATMDVRAYSNVLKNENFVRQFGVDEAPVAPRRREDDSRNYFQLPEVFDSFRGWNPF